jgi:hypothetical protein
MINGKIVKIFARITLFFLQRKEAALHFEIVQMYQNNLSHLINATVIFNNEIFTFSVRMLCADVPAPQLCPFPAGFWTAQKRQTGFMKIRITMDPE